MITLLKSKHLTWKYSIILDKIQCMQYIKYFSTFLKSKGTPHLNSDQMRRLLNIVALETTIKNVEDLPITGSAAYKMIEKSKDSLKNLTKEQTPENLLEEMMRLSQN